jgi:hypothetical protein
MYFMEMAESDIRRCFHDLFHNQDESMLAAAKAAMAYSDTISNADYVVPEASPIAKGTGKPPRREGIKQFPGEPRQESRPIAANSDPEAEAVGSVRSL